MHAPVACSRLVRLSGRGFLRAGSRRLGQLWLLLPSPRRRGVEAVDRNEDLPVVKGLGYFTLTEGVVVRLLQPWPAVPRLKVCTRWDKVGCNPCLRSS